MCFLRVSFISLLVSLFVGVAGGGALFRARCFSRERIWCLT
ncbi:hypothetical protein [Candidatus Ichthyocystis sparus]|nr:hypothetical protein [Candidatus Ichthyocystis sparus]